jgi:AbrB family looped-hinge helix DNA binding protein
MAQTVTVSSKYQIVIPKETREFMHIKPGDKMGVLVIGDSVHLVKYQPIEALRGSLHGMKNIDYYAEREQDWELENQRMGLHDL